MYFSSIVKALQTSNVPLAVQGINVLLVWLACCYFLCNTGEAVTNRYAESSESTYNSSWYTCSPKLQEMIGLLIYCSQQPVYMEGLTSVQCTRETFGAVSSNHLNSNIYF